MDLRIFDLTTNETMSVLADPVVIENLHVSIYLTYAYMPLIITSNILIFWGIILYPVPLTSNSILLLSLSMADFLIGAFYMPMFVLSELSSTRRFINCVKYTCLAKVAAAVIPLSSSLTFLTTISIDRYIAVLHPLWYQSLVTVERTVFLVTAVWVYTIFVGFLPMMGWNDFDPTIQDEITVCHIYTVVPKAYLKLAILLVLSISVPVAGFCNIRVVITVFKQLKVFRAQSVSWSRDEIAMFQARVMSVKLSVALMLVFFILWLPFFLIAPFKLYNVFNPRDVEIGKNYGLMLGFANSFLNAPVYAVLRPECRQAYICMLTSAPWNWKEKIRGIHESKCSTIFSRSAMGESVISEMKRDLNELELMSVRGDSDKSSTPESCVNVGSKVDLSVARRGKVPTHKSAHDLFGPSSVLETLSNLTGS